MSRFALAPVIVLTLGACGPAPEPKAPTSEVQKVTYDIPVVTAVEAGTETQQIKDTVVSVVPESFQVVEHASKQCMPVQAGGGSDLLGGLIKVNKGNPDEALKIYSITTEKGYEVTPKLISFKVEIKNRTTHVLPLDGVQTKLNINDKEVVLGDQGLGELHSTKLFPNDSKTLHLVGPAWDEHSEKAKIVFQMADIPVETDPAGKVIDAKLFTWSYQAVVEKRTVDVEKKTEQQQLKPAEARSLGCPG
jgi:hypothetical protein